MDKPNPEDYSPDYEVVFTMDEHGDSIEETTVPVTSYREAERIIGQRFPVASIDEEWTETTQEKPFWRSIAERNQISDDCCAYDNRAGSIFRHHSAYDFAVAQYDLDRMPGLDDILGATAPSKVVDDVEFCDMCGNRASDDSAVVCELCGDIFCCQECQAQHICSVV